MEVALRLGRHFRAIDLGTIQPLEESEPSRAVAALRTRSPGRAGRWNRSTSVPDDHGAIFHNGRTRHAMAVAPSQRGRTRGRAHPFYACIAGTAWMPAADGLTLQQPHSLARMAVCGRTAAVLGGFRPPHVRLFRRGRWKAAGACRRARISSSRRRSTTIRSRNAVDPWRRGTMVYLTSTSAAAGEPLLLRLFRVVFPADTSAWRRSKFSGGAVPHPDGPGQRFSRMADLFARRPSN